jgi:hypothetical protein
MNQQILMWVLPIIALIVGLVVLFGSKDKAATVGGYMFVSGFFILLWLLTFNGAALTRK